MSYSDEFLKVIGHTLEKEGGYVIDPTAIGGETNFRISKRAFPKVDIKNLTEEDAKRIYFEEYWNRGKCDRVPKDIQPIYFDMCVNFGIRGAIRVLQETVDSTGTKIDIDGRFGPQTEKLIQDLSPERVRSFRLLRFAKIVISKPEQKKFWYGWYRRCKEV